MKVMIKVVVDEKRCLLMNELVVLGRCMWFNCCSFIKMRIYLDRFIVNDLGRLRECILIGKEVCWKFFYIWWIFILDDDDG